MESEYRIQNPSQQNKRRKGAIQLVRTAIQLISFLLVPGLFSLLFSTVGSVYTAVIGGAFSLSAYGGSLLLVAAVLLLTLIWGRFFCGFICSFGAMQDLLWRIGKHIPFHPVIPQKADRALKALKYAVLLSVVVGVWTLALPGSAVWSPWTVFGALSAPWNGLPQSAVVFSVGGALLALTVIGSLFIERFFCKYLCPLGAIFSLVSRFRLFGIRRESAACSGNCRVCTRSCAMGIPLYQTERVRSGECINCMKCVSACPVGNITAQPAQAVSGTVAALALAGMTFAGVLPEMLNGPAASAGVSEGKYADGVYTGTAQGYRGEMTVEVTVRGGRITDITVVSARDDGKYLSSAKNGVIPAILSAQDTDVDTVSGATFSSRGIINAVGNALNGTAAGDAAGNEEATSSAGSKKGRKNKGTSGETAQTEAAPAAEASTAPDETPGEAVSGTEDTTAPAETPNEAPAGEAAGSYADGTYTGVGTGLRGQTNVQVTVTGGRIADVTVTSYQDDGPYFSRAQNGVIPAILSLQGIDVSTVSGATFSSNSILEAVADALDLDFTNPNASSGGHGGRR